MCRLRGLGVTVVLLSGERSLAPDVSSRRGWPRTTGLLERDATCRARPGATARRSTHLLPTCYPLGYGATVPEELSRAVAAQVRRLLEDRGMSGRQLALAAGINPRSMDRKLGGQTAFDVDDLAAVAPIFGVTPADLLTWAERG